MSDEGTRRRRAIVDAAAERAYASVSTVAFGALALGARLWGASRADVAARRGALPGAGESRWWFHGASAGEMAAAANLAALLASAGYSFTPGFTTTNDAGRSWAATGLPEAAVSLVPWDAPSYVERAFDRWRPAAVFLVETEIWPWLIRTAARRGVPIFSVSARLYPRDVWRYRAARPLLASTFARLTAVLAQDEEERERFVRLGTPAARCFAAGNLKHLAALATPPAQLAQAFEPLVVCGSIHADEMRGLFSVFDGLADAKLRFVVAPRHRDGVRLALAEVARRGWPVQRSSRGHDGAWKVLVLDTMGELASFYARGRVAVVGGGFANHGGHNPYEPVLAGSPVLFGEHFAHFAAEAARLTCAAPEARVHDWQTLAERLRALLADDEARLDLMARQARVLPDPTAIARRYLDLLAPRLPGAQTSTS